jgi:hypothetical protein
LRNAIGKKYLFTSHWRCVSAHYSRVDFRSVWNRRHMYIRSSACKFWPLSAPSTCKIAMPWRETYFFFSTDPETRRGRVTISGAVTTRSRSVLMELNVSSWRQHVRNVSAGGPSRKSKLLCAAHSRVLLLSFTPSPTRETI